MTLDWTHFLGILAAMWGLLTATVKLLFVQFEKRLDARLEEAARGVARVEAEVKRVDTHNTDQDGRLASIEASVQAHVAAGIGEIRAITSSVERVEKTLGAHVTKEEGETWGKLDAIRTAVSDLALQNERSHANLGERISKAESKLPNGELTRVLGALAVAIDRITAEPVVRSSKRK